MRDIYLTVAIVMVASISIPVRADPEIPTHCPEVDPMDTTIHLAHEYDCTLFYMCFVGNKILRQCPFMDAAGNRLHFNRKLQVCDWPRSAGCVSQITQSTSFTSMMTPGNTPSTAESIYTSSGTSETAVASSETSAPHTPEPTIGSSTSPSPQGEIETPGIGSTPPDGTPLTVTVSSFPTHDATHPTNLPTTAFPFPSLDCPKDSPTIVKVPHETNCSLYFSCEYGMKIPRECSPGTIFDVKLLSCDHPEHATCYADLVSATTSGHPKYDSSPANLAPVTVHTTSTDGMMSTIMGIDKRFVNPYEMYNANSEVQCPSDSSVPVYLPHETDCTLYYECVQGQKVVKQCPEGLHFNPFLLLCDWPGSCVTTTVTTTNSPVPTLSTVITNSTPISTVQTTSPPETSTLTASPSGSVNLTSTTIHSSTQMSTESITNHTSSPKPTTVSSVPSSTSTGSIISTVKPTSTSVITFTSLTDSVSTINTTAPTNSTTSVPPLQSTITTTSSPSSVATGPTMNITASTNSTPSVPPPPSTNPTTSSPPSVAISQTANTTASTNSTTSVPSLQSTITTTSSPSSVATSPTMNITASTNSTPSVPPPLSTKPTTSSPPTVATSQTANTTASTNSTTSVPPSQSTITTTSSPSSVATNPTVPTNNITAPTASLTSTSFPPSISTTTSAPSVITNSTSAPSTQSHSPSTTHVPTTPMNLTTVIPSSSTSQSTQNNVTDPSPSCPPLDSNITVTLPHECICSQYYLCKNGDQVLRHCPPNQHYNGSSGTCGPAESVPCISVLPPPYILPTAGTVNPPHPPSNIPPTVLPSPTTFIPPKCPLNIPDRTIYLPHETSCSLYYKCLNGEAFLLKCLKGHHFNPRLQTCDHPENVRCTLPDSN